MHDNSSPSTRARSCDSDVSGENRRPVRSHRMATFDSTSHVQNCALIESTANDLQADRKPTIQSRWNAQRWQSGEVTWAGEADEVVDQVDLLAVEIGLGFANVWSHHRQGRRDEDVHL